MDKNELNSLQDNITVAMAFVKAAEEVKRENAERERRNREKAAEAARIRRKLKENDEAYEEYRRNNPPTEQECREALSAIRACMEQAKNQRK